MVGNHSRQKKNSNLLRRGRRRWILLIINPLNCWAPVSLSRRNMASLENLGQTSGDYPIYRQNLGWSAKSKIPDRLGLFRHMKTRLNPSPLHNFVWNEQRRRQVCALKKVREWLFKDSCSVRIECLSLLYSSFFSIILHEKHERFWTLVANQDVDRQQALKIFWEICFADLKVTIYLFPSF